MNQKLTKYQKALDQNYLTERIRQRLNKRIKPEQLIQLYLILFREDEVVTRYKGIINEQSTNSENVSE